MSTSESRRVERGSVTTPPRTGRLVLGILLILLGAGWFVDSIGLVDIRWTMVLPAVLLVIGVVLLATAHRGPGGGLIGVGVVISVIVVVTSLVTIPFGGQLSLAGDARAQPTEAEGLEDGYGLLVGSLEIDLRDTPVPAEPIEIEIAVAVGQLVVRLPEGATVEVHARTGIGEVRIDGAERSGIGVTMRERVDGEQPDVMLTLVLSVGLGQVEVFR